MAGADAARPMFEHLARARCLVPLLGHVAVRLASLAPVRAAIQELTRRGAALRSGKQLARSQAAGEWADSCEVLSARGGGGSVVETSGEGESGIKEEAMAAAEEALAQVDALACFATELAELCMAEGQWLAALALAPQISQKLVDDFADLAAALEDVAQHARGCSRVAAQPAAAAGSSLLSSEHRSGTTSSQASGSAVLPGRGGPWGDPGYTGALHSMLTTTSTDLRADLEDGAFRKGKLAPELEASHEIQRWLLPVRSRFEVNGRAVSDKDRQTLLERIALFGGVDRTVASVARELEAAEQFCRVLAGASLGPPPGESRVASAGRDALVSEAQASGGSALHRWIRAQVTEPPENQTPCGDGSKGCIGFSSVSGGGLSGGGSSARSGGGGRPPFVKHSEIPHEFLCPITQDVMRDAVSTCDGHTYERRNIEAWLSEKSTSPITGLPLANKALIPNHNLRKLILDSGVLSRLEPDLKPAEGPQFRDRICCEIVVPRDAPTLSEALSLGATRATQMLHSTVHGGAVLAPGSRVPTFGIRLLPGDHPVTRALQIDQDVEILGSGSAATFVKLGMEAVLEFRGGTRLANLGICRDGAATAAAAAANGAGPAARGSGGRSPALVEVVQGNCRIEHCDFSNVLGSAIRIGGAHTSPTITRNTIHGCRDPGVVFQDGADGALTANRLFGNRSVAIEVHSRADPLIEDNDVFDGRQGGVFVYNRGKGHLRRNKIFRNALEGVEIKQGGRPLVEDNDIYDNLECGIFVHGGGEGRVIGNRIHSNSYAGIEIKDASSPEIRGNDVYSGRTSGMYVHSGGQGVIEGNQIHQNLLHGVYVRNKGCPHLLKNVIFRNDECGVFITESSHPCVEHNEVHSNGLAGIEVKEESNPIIKLNRIHNGNTGGIFVLARGRGRIFENKLYKNKLEGVEIKDGGDPQVTDNEIYENLECGVFAHDGALGRIEGNRIFGNAYAGVEIKDLSSPIVKANRIYRGVTSGIYVHSGGQGKLIENDVFENGLHGIMILSGGLPSLHRNKVHDNAECGVVTHMSYNLDSVSNQVYSNRVKNVQSVRS
eukprot:TRINITY_DN27913_c0_g1_i1.p1 TRINITY_DN27913_c0_g1~~TRINITY_DN27913_c0_g1_i1.p1  ORF type:complete len:1061 (-),score=172.80 TRINITY_DN27913_c0_g1_i1:320-3502(-)